MPLFSIITINYNNCTGLKQTMESVLSQTCQDYEYLVIDGGSTDGSLELIESEKAKLAHWVSEKDNGIYAAMNKGIAAASGIYCLFLNSGDRLSDRGVLQRVATQNPPENILYGELIFDYGNGKTRHAGIPDKITLPYLFSDNIWHPSTFIQRSLFDSLGRYKEEYRIAADYDFFFNAFILKKVTSRRLPFVVSIHLADGVSSQPENRAVVEAERNRIHLAYLSPDVIDSLSQLAELNNSGAVKFGKWLDRKPYLKRVFSFLSRISR